MTRNAANPGGADKQRDGRAETRAVIDIGSNSIKLRVIRREENALRVLIDRTELVRIGRGLSSGAIDEAAMRHGAEAVLRMVRTAEEMDADPRVVGTMALRIARNAEDFIREIRERTGIAVEVLSEEQEAYLAWLGAVHSLGMTGGRIAVLDIGGGSTQIIVSADSRVVRSESVSIGTVNLTEKFFASDPAEPGAAERAMQYIRDAFSFDEVFMDVGAAAPRLSVIGLGGGVLALASVKQKLPSFIPGKLDGTVLTLDDIEVQRKIYAPMPLAARTKIEGLPPKRADIILAGACLTQCALETLGADSLRVSINGLRHGLLLEMFGPSALPLPIS
ncbi:MAG: rod shape-determining protein [Synergistaceae bacterium]|jgi:exopolyphosphatase/guanosine-5'-triphosphate,3'-diphosphate pyrophosphatase|nr:rod shape-determining protein [Synergistaceae bacterium]